MTRSIQLALIVPLLAGGVATASAATIGGDDRDTLIRERRWNDIEILNSIESRERFQNQQQRLRETDRQMLQRREPRPEVQEFRPSGCPQQVFGAKYFHTCR